MHSDEPFSVRVGTFFMVIGTGILILFIASDLADKVDFDYLFLAIFLLVVGWNLRRKKAPPPSAGRFSYINKTRDNYRKQQADKLKAKQDAKKK